MGKINLSKPTFLILFLVVAGIGLTIGAASAVMVFSENIRVDNSAGSSKVEITSSTGNSRLTLTDQGTQKYAIILKDGTKKLFVKDVSEGKTRLALISNGNFGVGTKSPTEKLDVNGNIIAENYFDNGNTQTGPDASALGGSGNTASGDHSTVGGGIGNTASVIRSTVAGGSGNTAMGIQSTVVGGAGNIASGSSSFVGGGGGNTASGAVSTVAGGGTNTAGPAAHSTVGGGLSNTASGLRSTVAGGGCNTLAIGGCIGNTASGEESTVGGGRSNVADNDNTVVSGGLRNSAEGVQSTVGGGGFNHAVGAASTISGGTENFAAGRFASVPGGSNNDADGDYSFAAGRKAKALVEHPGAFVWADSTNTNFFSTAPDEFSIRAAGGVRVVGDITCTSCFEVTFEVLRIVVPATGTIAAVLDCPNPTAAVTGFYIDDLNFDSPADIRSGSGITPDGNTLTLMLVTQGSEQDTINIHFICLSI